MRSCLVVRQQAAAQDALHAGEQLREGERLDEVVIGAELEPLDAVVDLVARAEEKHRRLPLPADALQHRPAVDPGQHHVEQDQVVLGRVARCKPSRPSLATSTT